MMVFYSIKSKDKVFHLSHCRIIGRIHKAYRGSFDTLEEAHQAGYRQCNCCSPIAMRLHKEEKMVDDFCRKNGITYRFENGQIHIHTKYSMWRIAINTKTKKMFLYHRNTQKRCPKEFDDIPGYHSQAIRHNTIIGYLEYIVQHDRFRFQEWEKQKRREASKRELRKNTYPYRRGKKNCSFNAGQLYSLLKNLDL